jgi:hypothetical protein
MLTGKWVLVAEGGDRMSRGAFAAVRALASAGYSPAVTVSERFSLAASSRYCARRVHVRRRRRIPSATARLCGGDSHRARSNRAPCQRRCPALRGLPSAAARRRAVPRRLDRCARAAGARVRADRLGRGAHRRRCEPRRREILGLEVVSVDDGTAWNPQGGPAGNGRRPQRSWWPGRSPYGPCLT